MLMLRRGLRRAGICYLDVAAAREVMAGRRIEPAPTTRQYRHAIQAAHLFPRSTGSRFISLIELSAGPRDTLPMVGRWQPD